MESHERFHAVREWLPATSGWQSRSGASGVSRPLCAGLAFEFKEQQPQEIGPLFEQGRRSTLSLRRNTSMVTRARRRPNPLLFLGTGERASNSINCSGSLSIVPMGKTNNARSESMCAGSVPAESLVPSIGKKFFFKVELQVLQDIA